MPTETFSPTFPASSAGALAPDGPAPSGAVRLLDWGLIRAEGPDAAKFLQGQLTQDVQGQGLNQARLAGYCSAKGRLLASFIVWKTGPETFWLACSADLLAPTLKRLSMFVLRAQVKLSDASALAPLWGLVGEAAGAWLGVTPEPWAAAPAQGGWAVRLPDVAGQARWLWAGPVGQVGAQTAAGTSAHATSETNSTPVPETGAVAIGPTTPLTALPALPLPVWQQLEVASGVVRIVAATVEAFVPQMVNFELVGGVNFKKGCYPGQEVVARSQYRGTLKRRAALFQLPELAAPGQEVFHSDDPGQPAGTVALAAPLGAGGSLVLVEIKRAALASGSLHLGSAQGAALTALALPYAVPGDEA